LDRDICGVCGKDLMGHTYYELTTWSDDRDDDPLHEIVVCGNGCLRKAPALVPYRVHSNHH